LRNSTTASTRSFFGLAFEIFSSGISAKRTKVRQPIRSVAGPATPPKTRLYPDTVLRTAATILLQLKKLRPPGIQGKIINYSGNALIPFTHIHWFFRQRSSAGLCDSGASGWRWSTVRAGNPSDCAPGLRDRCPIRIYTVGPLWFRCALMAGICGRDAGNRPDVSGNRRFFCLEPLAWFQYISLHKPKESI
jgi:hypothetical protein